MTYSLSIDVEDRVRRDLAAFADARTEIIIFKDGFEWTSRRQKKTFRILSVGEDGFPGELLYEEQIYAYRQFFASDAMASLNWLSDEMQRSLSAINSTLTTTAIPAWVRDMEGDSEKELFDVALDRSASHHVDGTSLIFLQGRAGDGKSTSLINTACQKALKYAAGGADFLFLYIDAQGRALSRLDEAVALILDDLNAVFRYPALAVLTRLGLVVPIIDGFDELLGSGGYEDAFASLESFIRRLEGAGTVITSARSTFYQQSALGRSASRLAHASDTSNIIITNLTLLPWSRASTEQLLKALGAQDVFFENRDMEKDGDLYCTAEKHIGSGSVEILSSPFLTAAYVSLLREDYASANGGSIVESAIRALVQREIKEKLLGSHGQQILSESQFEILFSNLAEEMWWQEARTVDDETLRVVAEITIEEIGLAQNKVKPLLARLASNALIGMGESNRKLSFRHEIYYSYFLGGYFKKTILGGVKKDISRLVSRAVVNQSLARQCAWLLNDESEVNSYISELKSTISDSSLFDVVRINRGTLIAGVLKNSQFSVDGFEISDANFFEVDLSGCSIGRLNFVDCIFELADFRGACAPDVIFTRCSFKKPSLNEETILNMSGLILGSDISGVRIYKSGSDKIIYRISQDPDFLARFGLKDAASPLMVLNAASDKIVSDFNRVLRYVSSSIYFSEQDFENRGFSMHFLVTGEKYNIWRRAEKQRSGVRFLYTLNKDPDDLMAGALGVTGDQDILSFWKNLLK